MGAYPQASALEKFFSPVKTVLENFRNVIYQLSSTFFKSLSHLKTSS